MRQTRFFLGWEKENAFHYESVEIMGKSKRTETSYKARKNRKHIWSKRSL